MELKWRYLITMNDCYKTKDFAEIVYLLVNEAQLTGAVRLGPSAVEFIFGNRVMCVGLVSGMQFNDSVPLSSCLAAIRRARKVIHTTP